MGAEPQVDKVVASEPRSAPLYFSAGSLGLVLNRACKPKGTRETLLSKSIAQRQWHPKSTPRKMYGMKFANAGEFEMLVTE